MPPASDEMLDGGVAWRGVERTRGGEEGRKRRGRGRKEEEERRKEKRESVEPKRQSWPDAVEGLHKEGAANGAANGAGVRERGCEEGRRDQAGRHDALPLGFLILRQPRPWAHCGVLPVRCGLVSEQRPIVGRRGPLAASPGRRARDKRESQPQAGATRRRRRKAVRRRREGAPRAMTGRGHDANDANDANITSAAAAGTNEHVRRLGRLSAADAAYAVCVSGVYDGSVLYMYNVLVQGASSGPTAASGRAFPPSLLLSFSPSCITA